MQLNRSDCWYSNSCSIKDDNCINHCLRYEEMKYLMDNSGIPKVRQLPDELVPTCNEDLISFRHLAQIKSRIVELVKDGYNLCIVSNNTGNGKTSWAIKIMLKFFNDVWAGNGFRVRGMFVHVPTLLLQLKDFNNPLSKEYKDNLMNCDLVIWDDIASSGISNYDYAQLLSYIDQRILNKKSNIYTSNIADDMNKILGERLTSRINASEVIRLYGKDERYGSSNSNIE